MLEQWREGLRVSEAFDLEALDLSLDTPLSHHQSEIRQRRSLPTCAGTTGTSLRANERTFLR